MQSGMLHEHTLDELSSTRPRVPLSSAAILTLSVAKGAVAAEMSSMTTVTDARCMFKTIGASG